MWKWIIGIVVVFSLLIGGGAGVVVAMGGPEGIRKKLTPEVQATVVLVEPGEVGELTRYVGAPGTIEPRTKVAISAQVSARVTALPFREGQDVKAGDVIVRLDSRDLEAALESRQAALKADESRIDGVKARKIEVRLAYERAQTLFNSADISKQELDQAEANFLQVSSELSAAEHGLEVTRAQIRQAERDLDNTVITAPIDGTITVVNVEVGELVLGTFNNLGTTILEIAGLSDVELIAQVDEVNIAPVRAGQDCKVYVMAYDEKEYQGTVHRVGLKRRAAGGGTGYFEVEVALRLSPDERLPEGLTANVDIAVEEFVDIIKVPSQAVADVRVEELPKELRTDPNVDQDKTFARVVYVYKDGKAKVRPVKTGPSDLTHTIIASGLEAGEPVIVGPYKVLVNIKHDQAVKEEAETAEDGENATDGGDETDDAMDQAADGSATAHGD